jgi:hypothetical protein
MDPTTHAAREAVASSAEELDSAMDMRLAEDPLQRLSLEFGKVAIEADLAAAQSSSVFDRCTDQFDLEEDYTAGVEATAVNARQRRAQSVQLPTARGSASLSGIRGALQQMCSRSYRAPSDTARSLSTPESTTSTHVADKAVVQEIDQQETEQSQVVRWAKVGIPGATKLYAGWLRKLPKSKAHVQYDDCSLWKRRYITLVRQNRRGPCWKDALLVYHKSDEADR